MVAMNTSIFREYDIRGVVARDFPSEVVELLGRGYGTYLTKRDAQRIAISGDVRRTTPELVAAFKRGLLAAGIDVLDLGTLTTPASYFSMWHCDVDGAVQVTGSHNPPEFNGFKLSLRRKPVYGEAIQEIRGYIESGDFATGAGTESSQDIRAAYMDMLEEKIQVNKKLRVVVDCGNAAGCLTAPEALRRQGLEVTELFCDVQPDFPNHHPDPTVEENLKDLVAEMKTGEYDIGLAFDGDADRVGVVDENGAILWADIVMALLVPEVVQPGDEVTFDVKCSQALEEMIVRHGGKPVMWKTGHSLIKQRMIDTGGKLGGELSGHIFLADEFFGFDDAVYVALRICRLLARSGRRLSELRAEIPFFHSSPELRFDCPDDDVKFAVAEKAAAYFRERHPCIEVDGVRVGFEDGWGLVRPSNTQPSITCRYEARTPEGLADIERKIREGLRASGLEV